MRRQSCLHPPWPPSPLAPSLPESLAGRAGASPDLLNLPLCLLLHVMQAPRLALQLPLPLACSLLRYCPLLRGCPSCLSPLACHFQSALQRNDVSHRVQGGAELRHHRQTRGLEQRGAALLEPHGVLDLHMEMGHLGLGFKGFLRVLSSNRHHPYTGIWAKNLQYPYR